MTKEQIKQVLKDNSKSLGDTTVIYETCYDDVVEDLYNLENISIDHASDSFIETMKMQKQHHDEMEVNEARVGNYDTALAHRHRSGAIGDLMIRALNDR